MGHIPSNRYHPDWANGAVVVCVVRLGKGAFVVYRSALATVGCASDGV